MASLNKDPMFLRMIIMEHFEHPTHKVADNQDSHFCHYQNKSTTCIDDVTAHLLIEDGVVKRAEFSGLGCAISTASTDVVADVITGKTVAEAMAIIENYRQMIHQEPYDEERLGELIAFCNVPNQPNRLKCAQIGINAFQQLLTDANRKTEQDLDHHA